MEQRLLLAIVMIIVVVGVVIRGAFTFKGLLIFFSGMEADRNVKVVGGDVAVL